MIRGQEDARRCAPDVIGQLVDTAVPRLKQLLDRDTLLATVRARDFGSRGPHDPSTAIAVLLSDRGPSAELDELLDRRAKANELRSPRVQDDRFIAWIRRRVESRDHT
jgi:hypothetical protein